MASSGKYWFLQGLMVSLITMQESPTCKLLYVTPEQLVRNGILHDLLAGLHCRGRLARLVVDEVPLVAMSRQNAN